MGVPRVATKIFPTVNDVAPTAGDGITLKESNLVAWISMLVGQNFVLSGLTVPATSASLTIAVALGEAMIGGARVVLDASVNVLCTASNTNYIYLKLTKDGLGNITAATYEANITGTPPADSVAIATAVAGVGTITSTTDVRVTTPFTVSQVEDAMSVTTGVGATIYAYKNLGGF